MMKTDRELIDDSKEEELQRLRDAFLAHESGHPELAREHAHFAAGAREARRPLERRLALITQAARARSGAARESSRSRGRFLHEGAVRG